MLQAESDISVVFFTLYYIFKVIGVTGVLGVIGAPLVAVLKGCATETAYTWILNVMTQRALEITSNMNTRRGHAVSCS